MGGRVEPVASARMWTTLSAARQRSMLRGAVTIAKPQGGRPARWAKPTLPGVAERGVQHQAPLHPKTAARQRLEGALLSRRYSPSNPLPWAVPKANAMNSCTLISRPLRVTRSLA